jgi:hypothetical protein
MLAVLRGPALTCRAVGARWRRRVDGFLAGLFRDDLLGVYGDGRTRGVRACPAEVPLPTNRPT